MAACDNATDGYNAMTEMCQERPTTVAHCTARGKIYRPDDVGAPDGGGECRGATTATEAEFAMECAMNTVLIASECQARTECLDVSGKTGYDLSTKLCVLPATAAACSAVATGYVFNPMVGSGSAACFATATGCDDNEAAITSGSDTTCQPKGACLTQTGMTGYGFNVDSHRCVPPTPTSCFNVSDTAYHNGTVCVGMATACPDDFAAVRTTTTAICESKVTACTGGEGFNESTNGCVDSGSVTAVAQCAGLGNNRTISMEPLVLVLRRGAVLAAKPAMPA